MNFGTPVPLIIGVVLIVGAISLFFLDKIKPGYQRDSDIIYAFLCLLSGVMLLTDLTMGFALSLQQLMVVGMLVTLLFENVRSRVPGNRPTKAVNNRGRMRDDDYPPRRPRGGERAEAQLERDEEFFPVSRQSPRARRIRPESSGRDRSDYQAYDDYSDDPPRQGPPRRRPSSGDEDVYGQRYGRGSSDYGNSYGTDATTSSYSANQTNIEERSPRRRPLQLKGEIEDKTYTPDDYSSAVKALRNRRRQGNGTDSNPQGSGGPGTSDGYGNDGQPDDYVDYKPLDLPKPPGPRPSSGGGNSFDGQY